MKELQKSFKNHILATQSSYLYVLVQFILRWFLTGENSVFHFCSGYGVLNREIQLGEGLALLWVYTIKSFMANLKALENSECVHRHVHMNKVFGSL